MSVHTGSGAGSALHEGFVAAEVAAEFPGLRLRWMVVPGRVQRSPASLRGRLRMLSDRSRGAGVVSMRIKPVPHAFRSFFRQIGLDPDVQRIPSERVAVERLLHGEFRSVDVIADTCLVALVETGVPVWALDADRVDPAGPGIRLAAAHEPSAGPDPAPAPGSLIIADAGGWQAVLFEEPPAGRAPGPHTRRILLFAVAVDGVPEIHVEEALEMAAELLGRAS